MTLAASPAATRSSLDARALRDALGHFPTGVALVTTRATDGRPIGLTINSFASLSLDPPLVLWSLVNKSPSLAAFNACSHFAIHVLAAGQRELALRFANPQVPDKFTGVAWQETMGGAPLIEGALAHFICLNHQRQAGGDHTLFIGQVEQHEHRAGEPAVFHRGRFAALTP